MTGIKRYGDLTQQKPVVDEIFNELLDLVTDEVMTKETLAKFLLSADLKQVSEAIAADLSCRQHRMDLKKHYRSIKTQNRTHPVRACRKRIMHPAPRMKSACPSSGLTFLAWTEWVSTTISLISGGDDPFLGWNRNGTTPIEVYDVPGNHFTMLLQPHVEVLEKQLSKCLEQAHREGL